jgi:hypothetical protein
MWLTCASFMPSAWIISTNGSLQLVSDPQVNSEGCSDYLEISVTALFPSANVHIGCVTTSDQRELSTELEMALCH